MKYLDIPGATQILSCAAELSITRSAVHHDMFFGFSMALRRFERRLGELTRDPVWRSLIMPMRRYRFDISAAPLPFDYLGSESSKGMITRLERNLTICEQLNPDLVESGRRLLAMLSTLTGVAHNPLLARLREIHEASPIEHAVVVVKEPRLIQMVTAVLKKEILLCSLRATSVGELLGAPCFQRLFIIGPARWYPDYVFTAPRGRRIHLLKYAWLVDEWKPTAAFLTEHGKSNVSGMTGRLITTLSDASTSAVSSVLDPAEVLPRIDWDALMHRIGREEGETHGGSVEEVEYVDARLFLLEGDTAVALDCDESAKATVVDPDQVDQVDGSPIRRIPVLSVEPGMFILVRTQGGGEYIAEVADTIMGSHAPVARETQRRWKSLLRTAVITSSTSHVVSQLRRLGGKRPNDINVRNWVSYRTIRPQDASDFGAIMRMIGLGDQIDDYWATMSMIDSAHRRAGHRIAKSLLKEVTSSDLSQLSSVGRIDFTLPGVAAATLSALRVQGFHGETVSLPVHRLGRLIEVGDVNG